MNTRKTFVFSIAIMLIFIILLEVGIVAPRSEQAAPQYRINNGRKVIVLLVDYANLEDLAQYPTFIQLAEKSSMALISNRLMGTPSMYKSRLTYASGSMMDIDASMLDASNSSLALKKYTVNTGTSVKAGTLTYLDIVNLKNKNAESLNLLNIGSIGDAVHKNNKRTCVIGNSDGIKRDRSAVFLAMDSLGLADCGDVENILITDDSFPGGKRTDYSKLAELYKQYLPACSLMFIDSGDLCRLEQYRKSISSGQYGKFRSYVLRRIDKLVFDITNFDSNITLIVLSTYNPQIKDKNRSGFSSILVYDAGTKGLLYSKSTRSAGIITNTDFKDYLLYKLGIQSNNQVMEINSPSTYQYLNAEKQLHNRVSEIRPPVLKAYTIMVIISLALVLLLFLKSIFAASSIFKSAVKLLLLTDIIMPLIFLFLPAASIHTARLYFSACLLAAVFFSSILLLIIRDSARCFLLISLSTAFGILSDMLAGSPYMRQSVLGYDPIIGARFYGIGNEYVGVFIGAALIFIGCVLEISKLSVSAGILKKHSIWPLLLFTGAVGMPFWGANLGGAIAVLTGFFFIYIFINGIKPGPKLIFVLLGLLAALPVCITAIDLLGKDNYTHIGRLALEMKNKGVMPLYVIMMRKVAMNIKLIKYTIWTKVLLCIIAAVTVLFFKPVGLLKSVFSRYPYLKKAWISISAASIAGFIANDSGIVLAGAAMIYLGCTLLYICMELGE